MDAIPAYVHIAHEGDTPIASEAFLSAQWAMVQALLQPSAIQVIPTLAPPSPVPLAIESRRERSALAKWARPGAINVFVVDSLADVDEPGRQRLGVHWRAAGTHYVIVARYQKRPCPPQYTCRDDSGVLAHELGHFFGLSHDARADNLMSYARAGQPLWLDSRQQQRMRRTCQRELGSGALTRLP